MKSQLLILGNGFDLHCGLKSSYKDFFRQELLDTTTDNFDIKQLKPGVTGFWENLLLEYYKLYDDVEYKWCDIESIIKDTLWLVYYGEDGNQETNINNGLWRRALYCERFNTRRQFHYDVIEESTNDYVYKYCISFYDHLGSECRYNSEQENLNLLIERLLLELHSFENRFCKYIKGILNEKYVVNAIKLLSLLTGFSEKKFQRISDIVDERHKLVHKNGEVIYEKGLMPDFGKLKSTSILSFNYTAPFDLLNIKSPCQYSNVHGKLCNQACSETCNASNIIFGIDDTLIQLHSEYADLRLFSKTYRKMSDTSAPTSVLPKKDDPVDIMFYGHSLSEADYSYFQSIFDYYNLYGNNNVSLIFYYSKGYEQTDVVYRLINEYGKTLTNKDQGKNLMHKLLLENRIKIEKVD